MKFLVIWTAIVLVVFLIYVGYAFPTINVSKSAELWGAENKWLWYAKFCFLHFLYALIPIAIGGVGIFLWQGICQIGK